MISERSFAHSFDSFWSELLPLLTPRFVSLFNEAYGIDLRDKRLRRLSGLRMAEGVERPDIVAEFAFRLSKSLHVHRVDFSEIDAAESLVANAEGEALALIRKYEGEQPSEVIPLSIDERLEGLRLCERYDSLFAAFPGVSDIEFCPKFPGAGFLDSGEGDISIGNTLIEVKTTVRKVAGKDLRQLIIYVALAANAGIKRWNHIGLFNPRRGTLHLSEVDTLLIRLSGGKPRSDVFAELISFAESNNPIIEKSF